MPRLHRSFIDPHHHHGINCTCAGCNQARARREVEVIAQDVGSVRHAMQDCDTYSPRSGPEFIMLDDWSDD